MKIDLSVARCVCACQIDVFKTHLKLTVWRYLSFTVVNQTFLPWAK